MLHIFSSTTTLGILSSPIPFPHNILLLLHIFTSRSHTSPSIEVNCPNCTVTHLNFHSSSTIFIFPGKSFLTSICNSTLEILLTVENPFESSNSFYS